LDNLFRPDVCRKVGLCNEDLALERLEQGSDLATPMLEH
jgi:hypothetical protein